MCGTPQKASRDLGHWKRGRVSCEMRAVLLQVCCCTGGLCSAAVQFLLSLQHLRGVRGGNHLQSKSPQSNPTGFHASYSGDPTDVLTWHQGLALATGIPVRVGQAVPIPSEEDEEEQAAKNWGTSVTLGKQAAPNHRDLGLEPGKPCISAHQPVIFLSCQGLKSFIGQPAPGSLWV